MACPALAGNRLGKVFCLRHPAISGCLFYFSFNSAVFGLILFKRPAMAKEINTKILGGWLILVQAYIILNVVMWVKNAQIFWGLLGEKDKLIAAMGNNPNIALYTAFMYYEFVASVVFMIMMFSLFFIFFKKWSVFPTLMIITLVFEALSETFSYFYFGPISGNAEGILQKLIFSVVIAAVLIVYLKVSKRVKMTFIF